MPKFLKQLRYWWFRRKNFVPCRDEMAELHYDVSLQCTFRIWEIYVAYVSGQTIPEIAQKLGVTNERVRQCLLKAWRQASVDRDVR